MRSSRTADSSVCGSGVLDYLPVFFDNRPFWLPKTITSRIDSDDDLATWYFVTNYINYHKLTVNSRIITDVGDNPSPPPPQKR